MVEMDSNGGVTISMKMITLMISAISVVASFVGVVVLGSISYANLENNNEESKQDRGRLWATIGDIKRVEENFSSSLDSFKTLYTTKHQDLTDTVLQQKSRIDALSENLRILETNMNSISSALTASIREQSAKSDTILAKVNDLGTSLARLESDVRWVEGRGRASDPPSLGPTHP